MCTKQYGCLGILLLGWFFFSITASSVHAQTKSKPLKKRLEEIKRLASGKTGGYGKVFDPAFLKHVPPSKLEPIFKEYFDKGGPVITALKVEAKNPYFAEYRFFAERTVYPVKIGIQSSPPHLVETLWFGIPAPVLGSMKEATQKLYALPGVVSFAVCKLGEQDPELLGAVNPDRALAIGSTFKLYILGALIDEMAKAKRKWEDTLFLKTCWMSWPSGILHTWPAGTPMTLAALAIHMLSKSDNTATDHLLFALGRKKVEQMVHTMGNKNAAKNMPFLSTREMFLLKTPSEKAKKILATYQESGTNERRKLLQEKIAEFPRDTFQGLELSKPLAIEKVEWFASASDLCRAMDWIRQNTETPKTKMGRHTLSVNTGLTWNDAAWDFVGYKGGSEPGVLNLTWLAKNKHGSWVALSAGWNDTESTLDEEMFYELIQGVILLLEPKNLEQESQGNSEQTYFRLGL